jgi:uncharacterized protein (UPF0147 family)
MSNDRKTRQVAKAADIVGDKASPKKARKASDTAFKQWDAMKKEAGVRTSKSQTPKKKDTKSAVKPSASGKK